VRLCCQCPWSWLQHRSHCCQLFLPWLKPDTTSADQAVEGLVAPSGQLLIRSDRSLLLVDNYSALSHPKHSRAHHRLDVVRVEGLLEAAANCQFVITRPYPFAFNCVNYALLCLSTSVCRSAMSIQCQLLHIKAVAPTGIDGCKLPKSCSMILEHYNMLLKPYRHACHKQYQATPPPAAETLVNVTNRTQLTTACCGVDAQSPKPSTSTLPCGIISVHQDELQHPLGFLDKTPHSVPWPGCMHCPHAPFAIANTCSLAACKT